MLMLENFSCEILTLFRMDLSGAAHGSGGGARSIPPMIRLTTVKIYVKNVQKMYESRDTPLEFC